MGKLERVVGESRLVSLAVAVGALDETLLSDAEAALCLGVEATIDEAEVAALRAAINRGEDPLGDALCALRPRALRREMGATYTPDVLVQAMLGLVAAEDITRVVDPGAGSARLLAAAGARFPQAALHGIERDPLSALLARATLRVRGLGPRVTLDVADYLHTHVAPCAGRTLFLANPPYVRHHAIDASTKSWLVMTAAECALPRPSLLAGMHVYFLLATLRAAREGDVGVFLTSAEWLDVNYGAFVRALLRGPLGGTSVHVIDAAAQPFPDATTTAALVRFEVGERGRGMRFASVAKVDSAVRDERFVDDAQLASSRWSAFLSRPAAAARDTVELGEICRVHRGAVTGSNVVFIPRGEVDLPASCLVPAITRARELFAADGALTSLEDLRRVVDLPKDLDALSPDDRARVARFLAEAREAGADRTYVARARPAWWSVGLRAPAPILATYMARRPPAFVRNVAGAAHVNIAHGIYPITPLSPEILDALAACLRATTHVRDGRTYAGGLTKFEPREMERLRIPLAVLERGGAEMPPVGREDAVESVRG